MEKNDAQPVPSGSNEELLKEITAQYAILDSAVKLINQLRQETKKEDSSSKPFGGWVYNMKGLEDWVHHYTERRKLHCPRCNEDREFVCTECLTQYKYHDDL